MSEAFWEVQNARTEGYYIGKESMGKITKDDLTSIQIHTAKINGIKQGIDSMGKPLVDRMNIMTSKRAGTIQGENSMNNEQNDNVSENSQQEDSIMHKANRAWVKWATDNNINATNTSPETYKLMAEAFVDGYTNGFVKRFTEGE